MRREDVAILLDNLREALFQFAKYLDTKRDADIDYGRYLNELLIHSGNNFVHLKKDLENIQEVPYKSLYVFLPGNVPMVFFEVLPISIIFSLKTFFKYPHTEKKLYDTFIDHINQKFPALLPFFNGAYLNHEDAVTKINEFDFTFFFGSHNLIPLLQKTKRPFRFFGPGFSIGIAFNQVKRDIIKDVLYFDQQGCLSMRFLFYKSPQIKKEVISIFKKYSSNIPPTSQFHQDRFLYRLLSASIYGNIIFKHSNSAIIEVHTKFLPPIKFPSRTLVLKKINEEQDIIDFLKDRIQYLQAIATDEPLRLNLLRSQASFITHFGRLQYQPYNFFFKKKISISNIFKKEDTDDYKMEEDI